MQQDGHDEVMDPEQMQDLTESFLIEQYSSIRQEVNTRIQMRRKLIAAGLAFAAAFFGFVFSSQGRLDNTWLLGLLPLVIGFLMTEIFRSERMIKKAAIFIQHFEDYLDLEDDDLQWENTYGGYSNRSVGVSLIVIVGMFVVYGISVWFALKFWGSQPMELRAIGGSELLIGYGAVLLFPIAFLIQVWRI